MKQTEIPEALAATLIHLYGYIYGRYLGNIILDAFGNGAKDK